LNLRTLQLGDTWTVFYGRDLKILDTRRHQTKDVYFDEEKTKIKHLDAVYNNFTKLDKEFLPYIEVIFKEASTLRKTKLIHIREAFLGWNVCFVIYRVALNFAGSNFCDSFRDPQKIVSAK